MPSHGAEDVITTYEYFPEGTNSAGLLKSKTQTSNEVLSDGIPKTYTTNYTYEYGTLKTKRMTGVDWYETDRTIDPTGAILTTTDPSGFTTSFQYDIMGRITTVIPETTATTGQTELPTHISYPTVNTAIAEQGEGPAADVPPAYI